MSSAVDEKIEYVTRHKLLSSVQETDKLARRIGQMLSSAQTEDLRKVLRDYYPPDLADVMALLDDKQDKAVFDLLDVGEGAEVLDEIDPCRREALARGADPARLAQMLDRLPSDDAADIAADLHGTAQSTVLEKVESNKADQIRQLLAYPRESAGGIMSLGVISVRENASAADAIETFRNRDGAEPTAEIYVVDSAGRLLGMVDLRKLLCAQPAEPVSALMVPPIATVPPTLDQEQVARIFARYDLHGLPVVDNSTGGRLLGIITSDDIIDVIEQESTEDLLRMAGSDAAEMEKSPPARIAMLRLPWIMATMFIELLAGYVIHSYDATLGRILLLASFMPIISAISGNTGLQSATIIVRGISAGEVHLTEWRRAITRQLTMTLILGGVCGLVLGLIGAVWYGKWTFGLVVFLGMFAAVNIAGVVGTIVPLTSKRLGFDPAITSGPFETAFQDVVGISIFLTLATVMLPYML